MKAIKKFQGANVYEALQKVKADLGPDAIILESKQMSQKRLGCLPGPAMWEVTAASDGQPTEPEEPTYSPFVASAPAKVVSAESSEELAELRSTLAELQWEMRKLSRQSQLDRVIHFAPSLRSLYQQMREQEIEENFIFDLVTSVSEELSAQALNNYGIVADCAQRQIANKVNCSGPIEVGNGTAKVVFVIGPTGVGKTTTIAKLAAHFALLEKQRVLLVTTDTARIAALPQLKTYAELIGVPMEIANTPAELEQIVNDNQDKDLILVDNAGRSARNAQQIAELKAFVDAIPNKSVQLAVAASTRDRELTDIVTHFGTVGFDGLLVTKVDEALVYGPVLNVLTKIKKPISYLTSGQNVPEDIEAAKATKVASLVLGKGI
jgi:flagellar biosynthesis protein FlhF